MARFCRTRKRKKEHVSVFLLRVRSSDQLRLGNSLVLQRRRLEPAGKAQKEKVGSAWHKVEPLGGCMAGQASGKELILVHRIGPQEVCQVDWLSQGLETHVIHGTVLLPRP